MINWLFYFFGICRKHRVRLEWDGQWLTYVCPVCAREKAAFRPSALSSHGEANLPRDAAGKRPEDSNTQLAKAAKCISAASGGKISADFIEKELTAALSSLRPAIEEGK